MTLAEYLATSRTRLTDFAGMLGVGVTTLHGYVSRRRRPPVELVAKIEELTGGKVRAADLVPIIVKDAAA